MRYFLLFINKNFIRNLLNYDRLLDILRCFEKSNYSFCAKLVSQYKLYSQKELKLLRSSPHSISGFVRGFFPNPMATPITNVVNPTKQLQPFHLPQKHLNQFTGILQLIILRIVKKVIQFVNRHRLISNSMQEQIY